MEVTTSLGNRYSYNPFDNSISEGFDINLVPFKVKFKPLIEIDNLDNIESYTICVTESCNLRCSYCCYSGKYPEHRSHSINGLKIQDIPNLISFIKDTLKSDTLRIEFYGGESLLELEWIKSFVDRISNAFPKKQTCFELSTNGILLAETTTDWLVETDFHLFVSIDGVGIYHDMCRKDATGNGTFEKIQNNLDYIKRQYPTFWESNVDIMMTLAEITMLPAISLEWSQSELLMDKMPIRISEVANIYDSDTHTIDFDTEKQKYRELVKYRIEDPNKLLIKAFFDIWLAEWVNRPIFEITEDVEYPTCLPHNKKLYIDANGEVGLCERISDKIRIGNIYDGLNFDIVNKIVYETATFIDKHCSSCQSVRICDICPDILKLPSNIVSTYCHNQRTVHKIKFLCFCELAEADLI